jgi:DNA (cytosine-5)-methyltransferase 1
MKAIDLFAGLGGWTEGARLAGVEVVWAANHWRAAVEAHKANHPEVVHVCQDLHQANWLEVPRHDVLLASPSCQGFTKARGKERPHHDTARATAWAVVSCAEVHRPEVIVVENVVEFQQWELWPVWREAFRRLGYSASLQVLDAADFGVPQNRERLFVVFTRSRAPMELKFPERAHVPAAAILEAVPAGTPVRRLCARTRERVRNGRRAHGSRFLVSYYGSARGGRSLARPLGTVTTLARWALVEGERLRMLTVTENRRAMGFREDYGLPVNQRLAVHLLGNAVPPPLAAGVLDAIQLSA